MKKSNLVFEPSKDLSFRKRISIVKINTFNGLQELDTSADKIASKGNTDKSYYSLKSIYTVLNPLLYEFDLDIDIDIKDNQAVVTWMDCLSEDVKHVYLDIEKIKNIDTLPAMANKIMVMGSCFTYVRRYALTNALNLQAVDTIENNNEKTEEEQILISKIKNIIFLASGKNTKKSSQILGNATEFKNSNGEIVGRSENWNDIDKFKVSRLKCIYAYLSKKYPEVKEKVKTELDNNKLKEK